MEKYDLALHDQKKGSQWYIDSGYSKHVTRDQNKFISIKIEKGGSVTFGDNYVSAKIVGKGTFSLYNEKYKGENVFLVEDLKHNLLSVSQMCGKHTCTFNS